MDCQSALDLGDFHDTHHWSVFIHLHIKKSIGKYLAKVRLFKFEGDKAELIKYHEALTSQKSSPYAQRFLPNCV